MPLPAIAGESQFIGFYERHPIVDVYAWGSEITVAVRTQDSRTGPFTARVLRIDTALFEGP